MFNMKKLFHSILITLIAVFLLSGTVQAANYDYTATVYKKTGVLRGGQDLTPITTGITFKVLTANSDAAATITKFGDDKATSVTNPVTAANFASATVCGAKVQFRTTAATVDLIVVDAAGGGFTTLVKGFSPYDHSIVIDETPNIMHHGMIWFGASNNKATDTGVDFLPDTIIHDVIVEVVTVDATETISVGTADTATGFRSGVDVATAGYIADTAVITGGSNIDYTPVTTYGSLLATAITGSDAVTTNGGITRLQHVVVTSGTDDDLYYTGSAGSDTAAGYIHYFFTRLR
jgi:hypothetical protein